MSYVIKTCPNVIADGFPGFLRVALLRADFIVTQPPSIIQILNTRLSPRKTL